MKVLLKSIKPRSATNNGDSRNRGMRDGARELIGIEDKHRVIGVRSDVGAIGCRVMKNVAGEGLRSAKTDRAIGKMSDVGDFERMEHPMVIAEAPAYCAEAKRRRGTTNTLNHSSGSIGDDIISINKVGLVASYTIGSAVVKGHIIRVYVKVH
jgi:hypothetical protein